MVVFTYLGTEYRTNADASVIERNDGAKLGWNRTYSLTLLPIALAAIAA